MLAELVVDGRKRETGVFEKAIRLGTKKDPASVDVHGMTARMADGILIVRVPKVEVTHVRREVSITSTSPPSTMTKSATSHSDSKHDTDGDVDVDVEMSNNRESKETLFDADERTLCEVPATSVQLDEQVRPSTLPESAEKEKDAEHETGHVTATDTTARSRQTTTVSGSGTEHEHDHEEDDWERFSDDHDHDHDDGEGEGEYVKIAVN